MSTNTVSKEQIRFASVLAPEKRGFVYECSSTARWDQCYRASNILSYQSFFFDTYGDRGVQHSGLCCVPQAKEGVDWLLSLAKHLTEHPEEYDYTLDSLFGTHVTAHTVHFLKGIEKARGYYSISEQKVSKSSSKQYDKRWTVIPESSVSLNYFLDRIVDLYLVARTDGHRMHFLELVGLHLRVAEHLGTYVSISASEKLCKWLSEEMLQAAGLLYKVIGSLRTWRKRRSGFKNNQIGIDHTGTWTPAQYAIDAGWDYTCVEATAKKGVSDADAEGLTEEQQAALLEFCKSRVAETLNQLASRQPQP